MSDYNMNPLSESVFEEVVEYKECKCNKALSLGKVGYDGCQMYLKRGNDDNADDALLCACCDCHRNFHHKHITYRLVPQTQTNNVMNGPSGNNLEAMPERSSVKANEKRMRYTLEKKNQMIMFATSIDWKMKKDKKEEINQFCSRIGITRPDFVRWLSNNRYRAKQNVQPPKY